MHGQQPFMTAEESGAIDALRRLDREVSRAMGENVSTAVDLACLYS